VTGNSLFSRDAESSERSADRRNYTSDPIHANHLIIFSNVSIGNPITLLTLP
jgi:hypothetical protein